METLIANIPSKRIYDVNTNGQIFNRLNKPLKGKPNPKSKTLKTLDFTNLEEKRQGLSFQKIVWNTFHPDDVVQENEIIKLKETNTEYPLAVTNLIKISRKENVKIINEIRLSKAKTRNKK